MSNYWFVSPKFRPGSKLALTTCLLALVVILMGAYTRLTDAGLSCPDWPNCYGFMTAPFTPAQLNEAAQKFPGSPVNVKKAWTEMGHRYLAGTEGLLILALVIPLLFTRKAKDWKTKFIALALLSLLGVQVMLGMLTVTAKLKPIIVTAHLVTGLTLLSLLWWTYLDLNLRYDFFIKQTKNHALPWIWIGCLLVFTQITLGGWVSSHNAGLACIDFPYCNGVVLPKIQWQHLNDDLISIHMLHRIGAIITAIYLLILGLFLAIKNALSRPLALLVMFLVVLQFCLGVLNLHWLRPVWLALTHHGIAVLLLLTMITLLVKTYHESREMRHANWIT